jgi:SAM-dependent methyltransferase
MAKPPEAFARKPIKWIDGIPCYSEADSYARNYEQIARDHLAAITPASQNPWMPDDLYAALRDSTVSLIRKYSAPGDRLLDVGVSTGRLLESLTDLERYGIDISIDYLRIARDKGIQVALAKAEDMPYKHGFFSIATMTDVVEHMLDLSEGTRKVVDAVRAGGHIVVRTPYRENLKPYIADGLPYEFVHLRNFDEDSLRLHFEKVCGCEYVEEQRVAPYYLGPTRFRRQLFTREDRKVQDLQLAIREGRITVPGPVRAMLEALFAVREEDLAEWIYAINVNKDPIFEAVKDCLLQPLEINMVFRKK